MAEGEKAVQKKKKRQYSRNGCKECKRRKLKCDEGKPECWQCSHLGKSCIYVKNFKFSESRSLCLPQTTNSAGPKNPPKHLNVPQRVAATADKKLNPTKNFGAKRQKH